MGGAFLRRETWRAAFLTLAVLALLIKVATPQGFMAAPQGAGFALVICTGHGPLDLGHADTGDQHKSKSDAPCAFAGGAAAPTSDLDAPMIGSAFAQAAELVRPAVDLVPGRGLAAPPPPSQGPPILL